MVGSRPQRRKRLSADERREVIEQAATRAFAEHGYHRTAMEEVARRAQVTVPVLYDHFPSKQALHRRLLERHFAELRASYRPQLERDVPSEQQIARGMDAWFAYVQAHPYAWRMLFRDSGDAESETIRRKVAAESWEAVLQVLPRALGTKPRARDKAVHAIAIEVFRAGLQGLALWWYEHQDVPRERVVAAAMNALWIGFERVRDGHLWSPRS